LAIGWLTLTRNQTSLRLQTAVVAACLSLCSALICALGAGLIARTVSENAVASDLNRLATSFAVQLDYQMFERYREIENLVDLGGHTGLWDAKPQDIQVSLDRIQTSLPDFAWIGLTDRSGRVLASTQGMLTGQDVSARPWFQNGLKGPTVEDVHDAKLLDKLLRTSEDEAPFRFVDVAMPIRGAQGGVNGVLGAHLSWAWAETVRQQVLNLHRSEYGAELLVLDQDSEIILGGSDASPHITEAVSTEADGTNGTKGDVSFAQGHTVAIAPTAGLGGYPGLGWKVVATVPSSVVYKSANDLVGTILSYGVLVALLMALPAWFIAGRVTAPIANLTDTLDQIGRHDGAIDVPRHQASLEIQRLSSSVRSLVRRLNTVKAEEKTARRDVEGLKEELEAQALAYETATKQLGANIQDLKSMVDRDHLTGLYNRRGFASFATDAWDTFVRYRHAIAIMMLDADFFKTVNDTHGHAKGDEVIREIGQIISSQIRTSDKAARFGGEEFVVLLREVNLETVEQTGERVRTAIAGKRFQADKGDFNITVSIGCAIVSDGDEDFEGLIYRADQALYAAKAQGRDRVIVAPEPSNTTNRLRKSSVG